MLSEHLILLRQDLSVTVMSEKPITEVEIVEDPEDLHKIYKQSFIDEQEWSVMQRRHHVLFRL